MRRRSALGACLLGAAMLVAAGGTGWATPGGPAEPATNCGTFPRLEAYQVWNYDSAAISCRDAIDVTTLFFDSLEKRAAVDDWTCQNFGISRRLAEVETGLQCQGPRGMLRVVRSPEPSAADTGPGDAERPPGPVGEPPLAG